VKLFGSRSSFGIEVGNIVDASGHFTLNFHLREIHLNWADNQGYLGTVAHYFPNSSDERSYLSATTVPSGDSDEETLVAILALPDLWQYCRFRLGPVTDSFSLLVFRNETGVVLFGERNDGWDGDDPHLSDWNETMIPNGEIVHWLSVAVATDEYLEVIDGARQAILDLKKMSGL